MVDIVSVHVPKTAGSTFKKLFLEEVYSPKELFFDYSFSPDAESEVGKIGPHVKVIHGHISAKKYRGVFPYAKSIIWLREPVSRLISHYFFWLGQEKFENDPNGLHAKFIAEKPSFLEFCHYPYARNSVSRGYIQGLDLKEFYFVGIQDFFREDIEILADFLNMQVPKALKVSGRYNDNKYPHYVDAKKKILKQTDIVKAVRDLNCDDVDIYEEALALRRRRTKQF